MATTTDSLQGLLYPMFSPLQMLVNTKSAVISTGHTLVFFLANSIRGFVTFQLVQELPD